MILCAGRNETFPFAVPIGVGLIESTIKLTQCIMEKKPSFLLFVGTAGSYGNYEIFETLYSHQSANLELGFLQNQCYTPLETFINAKTSFVSRETNHSIIVNSSNYITTDERLANMMLGKGIELENMEFYSILTLANYFDIPCSGLFVVTNYCNKNAHHDFIKNHAKAKELITYEITKKFTI